MTIEFQKFATHLPVMLHTLLKVFTCAIGSNFLFGADVKPAPRTEVMGRAYARVDNMISLIITVNEISCSRYHGFGWVTRLYRGIQYNTESFTISGPGWGPRAAVPGAM